MRFLKSWLRFALFASTVLAVQAGAQPLERRQFAVGWPLELPAERGYFEIPLTVEVYRHAPSIEQLAVLDADGMPMPFYRVPAPAPEAAERRTVLPASPLYAAQAPDIAQLNVATDGGRTNVTVSRPADAAAPDVVAFVIDARAVEGAPVAIELDWRELPQPFLLEARIEQSADLTSWRSVGRASVAALTVGAEQARHARVPLRASAGGYYRVSWSRSVPDWYLESVTLLHSDRPAAPLETARFRALTAAELTRLPDGAARALFFDVGGPVPAASVTLAFAAGNGWASAAVATSDSLEGPWRPAATLALFYELDYGGEHFSSPPHVVARREARYWRFETVRPLAAEQVELEVRYPRDTLRFSAAGRAPYLLAAGTLVDAAGPDPTFADVWRQLRPAGTPLEQATLRSLEELGGAAALVPPFELPWRSLVLWTVLGAGVLAVASMAVRLAREMQQKPPEVPPGPSS